MPDIVTTFDKGMFLDADISRQPQGTYRETWNATDQSDTASSFGLTRELSHELVASFTGKIVGWTYIEEWNETLVFVHNGQSEIWLFNHKSKVKTFVCSDAEFGCTWSFSNCEFLYGEFKKFNKCKEMHVYWSSACVYHVVNIEEMLNEARKAAIHKLEDVCGHFDLMKVTCGPHISALPVRNNGSTLVSGAYACAVQLSDNDGNDSNIFDVGQFTYAAGEDNIADEITKSSIKFNISGLDKRYNKVHIYVVKTIADVTTIEKMDSRTYSSKGITFEYHGQKGELIDASVLVNKPKAYLRGQDLLQKDGFLLLYSIRNERNLNYQKYANQIVLGWIENEVALSQAAKYYFPSLLRGEVYAFAIVWKFCDGTYSPAFHIPAGAAGAAVFEELVEVNVSSGSYVPMSVSALNTDDQFKRERNPSEIKDRPHESNKLQDSVRTDANAIDTNKADLIQAADCHDNLHGCAEAADILTKDFDDLSNGPEANAELLAGFGLDKKDPDVNTTTTLKDAALKLIDDAVKNREYVTRKRPVLTYTGANGSPGGGTEETDPVLSALATSSRGDNWVDNMGNNLTDELPRETGSGQMEVYTSEIPYPTASDCDGVRFYPEGNIKHHRVPSSADRPPFVSFTNGVENQYMPDNHPYGKTYVRLIGIKVSNIHIPSADELPKPLCPHSPFKIVYVKRTDENKSIFAKGYLTGMFQGSSYGVNYLIPRNGVNGKETCDNSIHAGTNNTSHLGSHYDGGAACFHSPDTDGNVGPLPVNQIIPEGILRGSGWQYGLFTEGQKPEDQKNGTREDNAGARVANNLNHFFAGSKTPINLKGINHAAANTVVDATGGITKPLMNQYRESSTYLEAESAPAGLERDNSWQGGVLDHFAPTGCNAPYVALYKKRLDQYGSVEGLKYADLGITATQVHANGATEIKGICGDTFIGPYSKRRTAFVSNKRGDFFNVPAKPLSPCRERSWCDSPDDKLFEYLGINFYPTRLPESGDKYDPKNYAGLHTINGSACGGAISKNATESAAAAQSESDWFWPMTLKSLVHTIVECEVNPFLRETGPGPQKETGLVHYGNLKDLHLDAAAPVGQPWEGSWLGRFYSSIRQPSVSQLNNKALIRSLLGAVMPAGLLLNLTGLEGIIGPGMAYWVYPMLSALWMTGTNTIFTDKKLNSHLRIGECRRDEEGGDLDELVKGFEDGYTRYNKDFNRVNDIYPYTAFPLPYNTCPCNDCDKTNINNEIYYTNPQNPDSDIDAYKNIKINNYASVRGHYGDLKKLFVLNSQLVGHLTDGFSLIKLNPTQMVSDLVLQQSGDGQLLSEPQMQFEGVIEGYGGTEHPNAAISTPFGYFFVDNRANKLYRYTGQLEEISAFGMFHFFKENLEFCDLKECYDEKSDSGNHYSLGWDPRFNRLLVTKYDGTTCNSWTASFTPMGERPKWISLHSYIPQGYLWDRNDLYSITGGDIYKHHKKGEYGTYLGESAPWIVETVAASGGEDFMFVDAVLDTSAEKDGKKDVDVTFNKLAVYNSNQGTGTRDVNVVSNNAGANKDSVSRITNDYSKIRFHKVGRKYNINEVIDLVSKDCGEESLIEKECNCSPLYKIKESVFSCNTIKSQDYQGRRLVDDHIIYRFTLDNESSTKVYLKKLTTNVTSTKPPTPNV